MAKKALIADVSLAFRRWLEFNQGERWAGLTRRERGQIEGCCWNDFSEFLDDVQEERKKRKAEQK